MIKRLENSSLQDHTFHGHYFETSKEDLEKVCGPVMYNDDDSDEVTQNEWEMTTEDGTTFTIYDYKEFRYAVAAANKDTGVITYTSSAGTFVGYRKFAIKIEMIANNIHNAPFVKDYRGIALT